MQVCEVSMMEFMTTKEAAKLWGISNTGLLSYANKDALRS